MTDQKVVLITGASSGIGRTTTEAASRQVPKSMRAVEARL